jgi:hypothetical protein
VTAIQVLKAVTVLGFFSTGKKRRNYQQQQLIVGSKRAKNNVEETSDSKSYIKQESLFRNWISSMVKGISQSIQHDSNSLSLKIANPFFSPCIVQV